MLEPIRHLLLTAIVSIQCAAAGAAAYPQQQPRVPGDVIDLSPCTLPDMAQPARCGVLHVPENPRRPAGRQLPINVAVVSATGARANPDPIVVLMGGPGESAISAGSVYSQQFASLRQDRDLLLVDQRGSGRSGALQCNLHSDPAASLRDLFPVAAIKQCEQRLQGRVDLTQYTYTNFASDLQRVRRALGYGQFNLFAGSYGTRAAQVYMRAYPQSVRTAYLGSVVPIDVATPLAMAKTAQAAIERVFEQCSADAACSAAFPDLRNEFREVLSRLESGEVQVSIPGRAGTVQLYRGRVAEWIRSKLYRPRSAAILPWAIHRAYLGNWSSIVDDILSEEDGSDFSFGLFFAITCNEDVPFVREENIASQTRDTFLGDDRVREQQAACKYWPRVGLPRSYRLPVHSSVPTLFTTGDADGGTPLSYTPHVARGFPNAVVVVMRGQGHTEWSPCVGQLYQRLVQSGSVSGLDASSCISVTPPIFKTDGTP